MRVHIEEWPNGSATLITENGQVIWTFSSVGEARQACREWHNLVDNEPVILQAAMSADSAINSAA